MPLTVDIHLEEGLAIIELSGALTLGPHLPAFRRAALEVLERSQLSGLILQVSGVTATDSSGLGELTVMYSLAARRKCPIRLVGVSPTLNAMLEMTHLDGLLPTAPDMASAKKQLKRGLSAQGVRGPLCAIPAVKLESADMHGKNIIGLQTSAAGAKTFQAFAPREGKKIGPVFHEAEAGEVDRAANLAAEAAMLLGRLKADSVAAFLLAIREGIAALGDELINRAAEETALDSARLKGERERTLNQIRLFAELVKEGSWVDARIDTALPDRKPLPRPDLRRMLQPIGPVAVFGASNFPLAFSVAGGDTISAFAARNPVVVKAHPAHPGTSELVGTAIANAVRSCSLPDGTFSMLHGLSPDTSLALVTHPAIKAVGFTGSLRAGRAIFDAASARPDPIPVYAEMGSVNPVFMLPETLARNSAPIADGMFRSVTLGVGQFCTSPGLVFGVAGDSLARFREALAKRFENAAPGTMLNSAIRKGYAEKFQAMAAIAGVSSHSSSHPANPEHTEAQPGVFSTSSQTWLHNPTLHTEIFGPATVVIECQSDAELLEAANALEGSLTATIHGTPDDLSRYGELIEILTRKAGRLIFNGYPTGVEVSPAMHHGGPYPATTDAKFTSVGTAAIYRFARPVCYQGFPEHLLPEELQNANPRRIWRIIDGQLTRDPL